MMPDWLNWPETQVLVKAFAAARAPIRFVGGAVRDALLGREVKDVDAATPLKPDEVMSLLQKVGIRAIPTGIDHGTVTAVVSKKSFEITTLRRDISTDGRHAEVAYTVDWKQDASRRDFTINAIYLSPSGELFDYFDGEKDLKAGHVRFIGNAEQRIKEDYLRILRFFRFYAWFGKGQPDAEALAACEKLASHIEQLSGERIQQEMMKLLAAPTAANVLNIMQNKRILPYVLSFAVSDFAVFERYAEIENITSVLIESAVKLAGFALNADIPATMAVEKISERFRLPYAAGRMLGEAVEYQKYIYVTMPVAEQKRLLRKWGESEFEWAIVTKWACGNEPISLKHPYWAMLELIAQWRPIPEFPIGGDDLIALGITPGKHMGELLKRLEEEWEASDYRLSKGELLSRL